MGITIDIGEGSLIKKCQILVTTPAYFHQKLRGRSVLDLKHVKMVIFDEADEVFKHETNIEALNELIDGYFQKNNLNPQYILFSATFEEEILKNISSIIVGEIRSFTIQKQALNLKGVK